MRLEVWIHHQLDAFTLDVDFVSNAPVVALFGKSGSGKSSVVNAIAGLTRPDAGRIVADGTVLFDSALGIDLPPEARRIGYVFQEASLFEHLDVQHNLNYGLTRAAKPGAPQALSLYDTAPLKTTLETLVDFDRINAGAIAATSLVRDEPGKPRVLRYHW